MYRWQVVEQIVGAGFIAIVRSGDEQHARETVAALIEGGAGAIEVTMTTPGALRVVEEFADRALFGVGTVLSGAQAAAAAGAGASFVVTPNLEPDVITHALRHGMATAIGCGSVTEVVQALEKGADLIKLFPAGHLGPDFLRALHGPLPWAPIVPTGGVSVENAASWLDAGAVALGIGGRLCSGSPADIVARVRELRQILDSRSKPNVI